MFDETVLEFLDSGDGGRHCEYAKRQLTVHLQ